MKNQDQILAEIRDSIPGLWWALYSGCLEAGFSEYQAFELVKAWILQTNAPT